MAQTTLSQVPTNRKTAEQLLRDYDNNALVSELRKVADNMKRPLIQYPIPTQIRFCKLWSRAERAVEMALTFHGAPVAKNCETREEAALYAHQLWREIEARK